MEVQVRDTFVFTLRRHAKTVQAALRPPTLAGVRRCVRLLSGTVDRVSARASLGEPAASVVREGVLYGAFVPLLYLREGRVDDAAELLALSWYALAGGNAVRRPLTVRFRPIEEPVAQIRETLRLFASALQEWSIETSRSSRGRDQIQLLVSALHLSFDDLGRILGVSGETVRRWAKGSSRIPEEKLAVLDVMAEGLARLRHLFHIDRLPEVIRRPAELFDGQRALDWILQGRINEVADRYDRELVYQA